MDSRNTSPFPNAAPLPNTPQYNTYVGARYIPIFDGAWNSTKKYEPLVVVEHQGNSYTSKTYVPVGVDINNENYWAVSGSYNAQVEHYREEVIEYSNKVDGFDDRINVAQNGVNTNKNNITRVNQLIEKLHETRTGEPLWGKKVLLMGDSISVNTAGWAIELNTYLENSGGSLKNVSVWGIDLQGAINKLKEQTDSYDAVILFVGTNNYSKSYPFNSDDNHSNFNSLYHSLIREAKKLSNQVFCVGMLWAPRNKIMMFFNQSIYESACAMSATYVSTLDTPTLRYGDFTGTSDNLHPTLESSRDYLFPMIMGGINSGGSGKTLYHAYNVLDQFTNLISFEAGVNPTGAWIFANELGYTEYSFIFTNSTIGKKATLSKLTNFPLIRRQGVNGNIGVDGSVNLTQTNTVMQFGYSANKNFVRIS